MNVLLRLSKERKRKSMEYGNSTIKPKNEGKKKKVHKKPPKVLGGTEIRHNSRSSLHSFSPFWSITLCRCTGLLSIQTFSLAWLCGSQLPWAPEVFAFFLRFLLTPWRPNTFGDFLYILFHIQEVKEYQLQFYVVVQKSTELQGDEKSTKEECSPWSYLPIIKDYLSALWQPCMKLMYNNGFYPYSWHH